MVLPDPGYHAALRRVTRATGTLLLIDETHTISTGPRRLHAAARSRARHLRARQAHRRRRAGERLGLQRCDRGGLGPAAHAKEPAGHSGLGTTLSANALAIAAMRATLTEVMTDAAYAHMERARRAACGRPRRCDRARRPAVARRARRRARRVHLRARSAAERHRGTCRARHRSSSRRSTSVSLNRGCLIAPFHNMMLVCPATTRRAGRSARRRVRRRRRRARRLSRGLRRRRLLDQGLQLCEAAFVVGADLLVHESVPM